MPQYEYLVIPAPEKGQRAKGVRGVSNRFAHALQSIMNEKGQEGWRYLRTDTLPCEERQGLTRRGTSFQNMLVFVRDLPTDADVVELIHPDQIDQPEETVPDEPDDLPEDLETVTDGSPTTEAEADTPDGPFQPRAASLGGVTRAVNSVD